MFCIFKVVSSLFQCLIRFFPGQRKILWCAFSSLTNCCRYESLMIRTTENCTNSLTDFWTNTIFWQTTVLSPYNKNISNHHQISGTCITNLKGFFSLVSWYGFSSDSKPWQKLILTIILQRRKQRTGWSWPKNWSFDAVNFWHISFTI